MLCSHHHGIGAGRPEGGIRLGWREEGRVPFPDKEGGWGGEMKEEFPFLTRRVAGVERWGYFMSRLDV
jgi:hypothetical protein